MIKNMSNDQLKIVLKVFGVCRNKWKSVDMKGIWLNLNHFIKITKFYCLYYENRNEYKEIILDYLEVIIE